MPHIVVKLWPGKSRDQKQSLADAIVREVTDRLGYGPQSVSVDFEEVTPEDWQDKVYGPDIQARWTSLLKQPGYGPGPTAAKHHH